MAGSYNHVTTKAGNLRDNESFVQMIENLGDAYEATEEMYGMIWWLAFQGRRPHDWWKDMTVKDRVEDARKHYQDGLKLAKQANGGRHGS